MKVDKTIRSGSRWLVIATALTPVVVAPVFYPTIVPGAVFFRSVVALAVAGALYLVLTADGMVRTRLHDDPIVWLLGAFTAISVIASAVGSSPLHSLFGELGRMWGTVTWGALFLFYGAMLLLFDEAAWRRMFIAIAGVAVVASVYGVGRDFAPGLVPGVFGTEQGSNLFGNPGFRVAYLLTVTPVALALFFTSSRRWWRWFGAIAATIVLCGVLLTGERIGFLSLVAACGVGFAVYGVTQEARIEALKSATLKVGVPLVVGLLIAGGLGTTVEAIPSVRAVLERGVSLSAIEGRLIAWSAGLDSIIQNPLFGVGPENFGVAFDQYFNPAWWSIMQDTPWDRAHNAFLEPFVTTGILGGLAYVGVWAAAARVLYLGYRDGELSAPEVSVYAGGMAAYATYLFFWFETLEAFVVFVTLVGYWSYRVQPQSEGESSRFFRTGWSKALTGVVLMAAAYLAVSFFVDYGRAARHAYLGVRSEALDEITFQFDKGLSYELPGEDEIPSEYARVVGGLAQRIRTMGRQNRPQELLEESVATSLSGIRRAVQQNPKKVELRIRYAGVLATAFVVRGEGKYLERAVEESENAVAASPNRVVYYHRLADLYLVAKDPRSALAAALEARRRYGSHPDTYFYLAQGHAGVGNYGKAFNSYMKALRLGYVYGSSDRFLLRKIVKSLPRDVRLKRRRKLCEALNREVGGLCPEGRSSDSAV